MPDANVTRVETTLIPEDAALLDRVAKSRGTTKAEILRNALYEYVEPLRRARDERNLRIYQEVEERRRLREWNGFPR